MGVRDREAFEALTRPFGFLSFDDCCANLDYMSSIEQKPDRVYATYGTGQRWDLLDIPSEVEDPDYHRRDWPSMTFEEIVLDVKTRPEGQGDYYESLVEKMALELERFAPSSPIRQMTPDQWVAQLQDAVSSFTSLDSVETWT